MKKLLASTLILPALISGCATKTEQIDLDWRESMTYAQKDSYFKNQISMGKVTGVAKGRYIPWSAISQDQLHVALENSLSSIGLLARGDSRYVLETELVKGLRPYQGLDRAVEMQIRYTLVDLQEKNIVYDNVISTPSLVKIEENYSPFTWAKKGVEKATQRNISQLVGDIYLLGDQIQYGDIGKIENDQTIIYSDRGRNLSNPYQNKRPENKYKPANSLPNIQTPINRQVVEQKRVLTDVSASTSKASSEIKATPVKSAKIKIPNESDVNANKQKPASVSTHVDPIPARPPAAHVDPVPVDPIPVESAGDASKSSNEVDFPEVKTWEYLKFK